MKYDASKQFEEVKLNMNKIGSLQSRKCNLLMKDVKPKQVHFTSHK
jgi:uncharacterized pyridoxal phosphate-containing UPF0001 family protein